MGIFNQSAVLESLEYNNNRKNDVEEFEEEAINLDEYGVGLESWEYSDIRYQADKANAAIDEAMNTWFKEIGINELAFAEAFHEEIDYESVVTENDEEGAKAEEEPKEDPKAEETKSANKENGGKFKAMLAALRKTVSGIVNKVIAKLKEIAEKAKNRAKAVLASANVLFTNADKFGPAFDKIKDNKVKVWTGLGNLNAEMNTDISGISNEIVQACLSGKVVANDGVEKETGAAKRYDASVKKAEVKGVDDPAKTVYALFFSTSGTTASGIPYKDVSNKESGAAATKLGQTTEKTVADVFGGEAGAALKKLKEEIELIAKGSAERAAKRVTKAQKAMDKAIAGVEAKVSKGSGDTAFLTGVVAKLKPFITEFNSAAAAYAAAVSGTTNETLKVVAAAAAAGGKKKDEGEAKAEEPTEKKEEEKKGGEEETKEESYSFLDALNGLI